MTKYTMPLCVLLATQFTLDVARGEHVQVVSQKNGDSGSKIVKKSWPQQEEMGDSLYLSGFGTSDQSIQHCVTDNRLRSLSIESLWLTEEDCCRLAEQQQIEALSLVNNGIGNREISKIAKLPNLRVLDLRGNPITDDGLEYLFNHKRLLELDLRGTCVTFAGVSKLQQRRPELRIEFTRQCQCGQVLTVRSSSRASTQLEMVH